MGNAKDAIKEKKGEFADIGADLDLLKVRHCAMSHVVMLNSQFKNSPSIVLNIPLELNLQSVTATNPLSP